MSGKKFDQKSPLRLLKPFGSTAPEQRYSTQLDQNFLLMIFEKNLLSWSKKTFLVILLQKRIEKSVKKYVRNNHCLVFFLGSSWKVLFRTVVVLSHSLYCYFEYLNRFPNSPTIFLYNRLGTGQAQHEVRDLYLSFGLVLACRQPRQTKGFSKNQRQPLWILDDWVAPAARRSDIQGEE